MKKTILLLTNSFPYSAGEQFLEDELAMWSVEPSAAVVICPLLTAGAPRPLPATVRVISGSPKRQTLTGGLIARAFCSRVFWREVVALRRSARLQPSVLLAALKATAWMLHIAEVLSKQLAKAQLGNVVVYSYWNDLQSYAAVALKRRGLIEKVIARAHGFDLYEDRRPNNYMPLKRQFINDFDAIAAISKAGQAYLQSTYGLPEKRAYYYPLGVLLPGVTAPRGAHGQVHICSVSFCVQVKRIDKIIKAIAEAAARLPETKFRWTHIGTGPLTESLTTLARRLLPHIEWEFKGHLEHPKLLSFYKESAVDFFINASESEGVPVTIMEAMSFGIPAIAPSVGGIAEIVTPDNGLLLQPNFPTSELASAIVLMTQRAKTEKIRKSAQSTIAKNYDAKVNHRGFIAFILSLAGHGS